MIKVNDSYYNKNLVLKLFKSKGNVYLLDFSNGIRLKINRATYNSLTNNSDFKTVGETYYNISQVVAKVFKRDGKHYIEFVNGNEALISESDYNKLIAEDGDSEESVIVVNSYENLPIIGEEGKMYVTTNTGYIYIYTNGYVQVGGGQVSADGVLATLSPNGEVTGELDEDNDTLELNLATGVLEANPTSNSSQPLTKLKVRGVTYSVPNGNIFTFIGTTATPLSDGSTTNPITIDGQSVTAVSGNVVFYGDKEFVYGESSWEELGYAQMVNPMTNAGDIIIGGSAGTPTRLGIGANGKVLKSNGTTISWQDDNNTTYSSQNAAQGGTTESLVTTGEKYTWNNKQNALVGSGAGQNIKTINNTSILGSGNIDTKELPTLTGNSGKVLKVNSGATGVEWATDNVANVKSLDTTNTTAQSTNASESIEGTGTIKLHKVSKTGSYNDLLNKPTIPTVNNATLTITQNGESVGTFTANASSNVTIATTDTTYSSQNATEGGTTESLVTTGEKYTWNSKQNAIAVGSELSADLVDDTNTTNKFVTASDKTNWDNKLNQKPDGTHYLIDSSTNKVNTQYIPDYILGQLVFGGTFNANTAVATLSEGAKSKLGTSSNSITLTNNTTSITGYTANENIYYVVSTAGTFADITFKVGDWLISIGTAWNKVDNTDEVSSVQIQANSGLTSSTSTAQTGVVSTTISVGSGYKLPTTTEWASKQDALPTMTDNAGKVLKVNSTANGLEWATDNTGMANPMTTQGDIIIGGASGTPTRLAKGSNGKVLKSDGTTVSWQDDNDTTYTSESAVNGGTNVSLVTTGEKYTWNHKQDALVSGTNIKTINNTSILGSGDIDTKELPTLTNNAGKVLKVNSTATGVEWGTDSTISVKSLDTSNATAQSTNSNESIEGSGTIKLHKVSKTGSYEDLLNKPTIPTVNNATLTITQNGTSVGTFSANASTNVTIATTDTTYSSKSASNGGTEVSLVTTGEKYTWNNKQDEITSSSKLSADLVDDSNATNKFVTASDKTNWDNKLDQKPDGTNYLIDSATSKINTLYIPDYMLGQLVFGGTVNANTAVAALSEGAKSKLGTSSATITLTNDTTAITGFVANENIYYVVSTAGSFAGITFKIGDWLISTGSAWSKVDNTDEVTSVQIQAGTGLTSSTSTAQTGVVSTTISVDSGYKLPTTTEWSGKQDSLPVITGNSGKVLKVNSDATGLEWGVDNAGMSNPMTAQGDIIIGGTSGTPTRLAKGSNGKVLKSNGTTVSWQDDNDTTYSNESAAENGTTVSLVTTGEKYTWNHKQDALVSGTSIKTINNTSILGFGNINTKELPTLTGNGGKVLKVNSNADGVEWATDTAGMSNPMTTQGDIIIGGSSGTPTRLAKGSNGKVLKSNGTTISWQDDNDTTYSSESAVEGGTNVSLVTTGEKYTWNNKQDKITSSSKLSADLVNDSDTTNKFVTASDKTNWDNKLDQKPDGTNYLIDSSTNKINTLYIPDYVLGQLVFGGTVNANTAVATLSDGAKSKLGTSSTSITLTNDTTAITGFAANENIYYIVSTAGTFAGITFKVGDWLISTGSAWNKVDNTDEVASVQIQAGTGLTSSVSTAQTGVVSTTISVDSGYKLPTTTEWSGKQDALPTMTGNGGKVLKVNSGATGLEWATDNAGMNNPMTAQGDIIIGGSSGTPTRLAKGTSGKVLKSNGTTISWEDDNDTTYTSKSAVNGGTDVSLVTTGEKYTWDNKQATLVGSGTGQNIKTINNTSILGSGNIDTKELPSLTNNAGKVLKVNANADGVEWGTDSTISVKSLDTTSTTAQTTNASEAIEGSGTIKLHKVSKTGSYSDLLDKPIIPTVNNATLTITQNGTSVGTFTANASSNVTIATTDTTYTSKSAVSGGNEVSLVTTGEKYTWNGKQNAITTGSELSADLVSDSNTTNKFVTASDKTNWDNKLNQKPDGTNYLIDSSTNKINTQYIPDYILGQLIFGGPVNANTGVATLSEGAKSKLGTSSTSITLTNNTTAITGYTANENIYYVVSTAGTFASISFKVGDWLISTGSAWSKVDNTDEVTSVQIQAGTGLTSSTSTAQTGVVSTTISVDSGYKLPTTTEWSGKQDALPTISGNGGKVLKVNSGATGLEWATDNTGMSNPMTAQGDIIIGGSSGTPTRLAKGSNGKVLKSNGTTISWQDDNDTTYSAATTSAAGLMPALGSSSVATQTQSTKFLREDGTWSAPSYSTAGMSNPMTTQGDIIIGGSNGAPTRLAVGSSGKVLTSNGSTVSWQTPSGANYTFDSYDFNVNGNNVSLQNFELIFTLSQNTNNIDLVYDGTTDDIMRVLNGPAELFSLWVSNLVGESIGRLDVFFAGFGSTPNIVRIRARGIINCRSEFGITGPAELTVELTYDDVDEIFTVTDYYFSIYTIPVVSIALSQVISQSPITVQLTGEQYKTFSINKQVLINLSDLGKPNVIWDFGVEDNAYIIFGFTSGADVTSHYDRIQISKSDLTAVYTTGYKTLPPSSIGTGTSADANKLLAMNSSGWGTLTNALPILTTAPSAANTGGGLIIVVLTSEPATKYDGYLYIIKKIPTYSITVSGIVVSNYYGTPTGTSFTIANVSTSVNQFGTTSNIPHTYDSLSGTITITGQGLIKFISGSGTYNVGSGDQTITANDVVPFNAYNNATTITPTSDIVIQLGYFGGGGVGN